MSKAICYGCNKSHDLDEMASFKQPNGVLRALCSDCIGPNGTGEFIALAMDHIRHLETELKKSQLAIHCSDPYHKHDLTEPGKDNWFMEIVYKNEVGLVKDVLVADTRQGLTEKLAEIQRLHYGQGI